MKKRRPRKRNYDERPKVIRLWTQNDIIKAFPYMRSLGKGLREHWLAAATHGLQAKRLHNRPGRPDRKALIAMDDARDEERRAFDRFEELLEELNRMDVFCVDPVRGIIWVPFRSDEDLAWYVFDSFDDKGLVGWRKHDDDLEMVRPLSQAPETHVA